MALTEDVLQSNEVLKTLSPEQISVITKLSANDENTVIGKKIGEIHSSYEKDVFEISGVQKNNGEKGYEYTKRVLASTLSGLKEYQTKLPEYETKTKEYETQIKNLQKSIEEGKGNEQIVAKLKDVEKQFENYKNVYTSEKEGWQKEKELYEGKVKGIYADFEIEKALVGLKFKPSVTENMRSLLVKAAVNDLKSAYNLEVVESEGKAGLVIKDKNGNILMNKANSLNPFTVQELLSESLKDSLDFGNAKQGTGTNNTNQGKGNASFLDLSGIKTQREATDVIHKHLSEKGLAKNSPEYVKEVTRIRKENNVGTLPF